MTVSPAPLCASSPEAVSAAAAHLRAGALVGLPTETVYGLAANARDGEAVARIFAAKGRPSFNPLIVHVPDLPSAERLGLFDATARALAARFWPGPLTLVVPRRAGNGISELATAGLKTIALRVPAHDTMQAVLIACGLPLAAPSANPSGRISPTRAAHVAEGLGEHVAMILDGGPCTVGLESTVVAVDEGRVSLLRPGAITRTMLEEAIGPLGHPPGDPVSDPEGDPQRPASPGLLLKHYAPRLPVRLEADDLRADEALLAFGPDVPDHTGTLINLSKAGNLIEAAANLFASLRTLDASGASGIAVMPIPREGLGEAINDRLSRAAAGGGEP